MSLKTNLKILILEDDPERHKLFIKNLIGHDVTIVDNVSECISLLDNNYYHFLFLDHDLGGNVYVESGGDEETGYDVAKWMYEKYSKEGVSLDFLPLCILVHSLNPDGRKNIVGALKDMQKSGFCSDVAVREAPFIWGKEGLAETLEHIFFMLATKH